MQLLDTYLKAVAKGLPVEQREDILRELSEDIRSEMDEKSGELGRPLSEAEQQEILKRHGNPLLLAAQYRHDNRSLTIGRELIGPALFPFYVKVLSFNLGLTFVVIGAIFTALVVSGQKIGFSEIASNALMQLIIQLSVVTVIFSLIQKHMNRAPDQWKVGPPRGLHLDLRIGVGCPFEAKKDLGRVSRFDSISILVASGVALVWLKEVQLHPFLIFGPATYFLKLAPIWSQAIPIIAVLTFIEMARSAVNLMRPDWARFRIAMQALTAAAGLGLVRFMVNAGAWVTLADPTASEGFRRAADISNRAFFYGLLLAAVFAAIQLFLRVSRLLRAERKTESSRVDVVC